MEQINAIILMNGRLDNKNIAVCEAPDGGLFYAELPEEYAPPGFALPLSDLSTVTSLSQDIQRSIKKALKDIPAEELEDIRSPLEEDE